MLRQAERLRDEDLRRATLDAIFNPRTCVRHRAGLSEEDKDRLLDRIIEEHLVNPADGTHIPCESPKGGSAERCGLRAGIFPALVDDGSDCPRLPQTFFSTPGSSYGGHHSYPGGLAVHESFNTISDISFAHNYRRIYGSSRPDGLPVIGHGEGSDITIDEDEIIAAPIWHDWGKIFVFQWNANGSEFAELSFGGKGDNDDYGNPGDSRTGGHHILGGAEAMKRELPPEFVITQLSAHSTPTLGNEYKVVNWIRAAAILAQIDPIERGYLRLDGQQHLRLPALRRLGEIDLNAASQTNVLAEYELHNLSHADFSLTGPAVGIDEAVLRVLAPEFGYDPADVSRYNRLFRNPALSYLSAERLLIEYGQSGLDAVRSELRRLRQHGVI